MESARYPVATPDLVAELPLREPEDLLSAVLLHDETMDAWAEWFRLAGLDPPALPRGPCYPNCEYSTTAAEKGQGVELAYDAVVRDTVRSGSLVKLFDTVTMPIVIYSVAIPADRRADPLTCSFRDWIFEEAARECVIPSNLAEAVA